MPNKNDFTIGSIIDKIVSPKMIYNLIDDIDSMTRNIKNISFICYSRPFNYLVDRIIDGTDIISRNGM